MKLKGLMLVVVALASVSLAGCGKKDKESAHPKKMEMKKPAKKMKKKGMKKGVCKMCGMPMNKCLCKKEMHRPPHNHK